MTSRFWASTTTYLLGLLAACAFMGAAISVTAADTIEGTATLSGKVKAEESFKAARVYARNLDKSVLYMVYTNRGKYEAINLMPGGYEVWSEKGELASEHQQLRIQAGNKISIDFSLSEAPPYPLTQRSGVKEGIPQITYEEMYPNGPGKELAEGKCIACHGQSFLPNLHMTKDGWDTVIGIMLDPDADTRALGQRGAMISGEGSVGDISPEEREVLAEYLATHFGPESGQRALKKDVEYPLDEKMLSKALFVEYLMPLSPKADLTRRATNDPLTHRTVEPHIDNSGNIWATNGVVGVSRVDPRTAEWSHFPYPSSEIFGHGMTVDSKGDVFWAELTGAHIGRLDPETGKMDRFPMDPEGLVRNIQGHTPHLDSEENVWFTVIVGNRIGKWDRKTEKITLYEAPTDNSFPYGIDVDQNDEVWFAQLWGCNVGRFNPQTEEFTEYPALDQPCAMNRLAADSKGTIWYSLVQSGKLGKLDPKSGKQVEYDILPFRSDSKVVASGPYGIIADHEDKIWFGDHGLGGALIKFDPDTEEFAYYPLPRQTDNPNIDRTGDGAIVYTTRSNRQASIAIMYPDASKMTTFGAFR